MPAPTDPRQRPLVTRCASWAIVSLLLLASPGCTAGSGDRTGSDDGATHGSDAPRQAGPTTQPADGTATVLQVIDGDTIEVRVQERVERVRLLEINTPESVDPRRPVMCFGKEASHFLASVLPEGTEVRLERDVELRDDYGRVLAYVFRTSDELFVNLELARQGYAEAMIIAPNVTHAEEIRAAVADARRAGSGLWAACDDPFTT